MKYSEFFDRRKNTFERSYDLILQRMKGCDHTSTTYSIVELGPAVVLFPEIIQAV